MDRLVNTNDVQLLNMKVVLPDYLEMSDAAKVQLEALGATVYEDLPQTAADTIARIRDAQIIIANYADLTPEVIDAAPNLKYMITPSVGFNHINVDYATQKGIKVLNCPTFVTLSVAEHVMMLLFSLARKIVAAAEDLKSGNWDPAKFEGVQIAGKKLGLVGYGNIGKKIEALATGLGMGVSYVNSKSTSDKIDDLLRESDFVVLCLPLNDHTKHIIDAERIALLKKSAFLINIARGPVIDQDALIKALESNSIAGAGLDVFNDEPLQPGPAPVGITQLANLPNVIATPHSAFNTPETITRRSQELYENIVACMAGKPINIIN